MTIFGTSGDDNLPGTDEADAFDVSQGGNDTARGFDGDDTFSFGGTFNELDRVRGGEGLDALLLDGDYSTEVRVSSANFQDVEAIFLFGANDYLLTFEDSALASGQVLDISAAFAAFVADVQTILIDAHTESDAAILFSSGGTHDIISTGGGNDVLNTGDENDSINPGLGRDTINGGDGADRITFLTSGLNARDRVEGGDTTSDNTIILDGDYSGGVVLAKHTITNIKTFAFDTGNDYVIDLGKSTLSGLFRVDALPLGVGDTLDFDGSHARGTYTYAMTGGSGDDRLTGGIGDDGFSGNSGADRIDGGGGSDNFTYGSVGASTGKHYDTIVGFDPLDDTFVLRPSGFSHSIDAVDAKVTEGHLSTSGFDDDLEAAIGDTELAANHAVLFKPDGGSLAGQLFLIVDVNGEGGYQTHEDLVLRMQNGQHLGDLSPSDFSIV